MAKITFTSSNSTNELDVSELPPVAKKILRFILKDANQDGIPDKLESKIKALERMPENTRITLNNTTYQNPQEAISALKEKVIQLNAKLHKDSPIQPHFEKEPSFDADPIRTSSNMYINAIAIALAIATIIYTIYLFA